MIVQSQTSVWISFFILIMFCLTIWQISKITSVGFQLHMPAQEFMHVPKIREETEISYSADSLPKWDYTRLINMDRFTFLTTNTVCNEITSLDVLVVIHSAPKNLDKRNAIRESWGQPRQGMKVLFMLGGVDDQKIQDDLDQEDRKYHDLIQGNFKDAYKNMTYKHIMAFKYTVYFCPTAKYILKVDDDLFINMPVVMDYIETLPAESTKNFILCSIMDGSPAIRKPSKWQVPFNEYPHSSYPIYCSGFAILYSYDVVFRLYREGQRGDYFWVDDAHVTGTLAKRINLKHTRLPDVLMSYKEMDLFLKNNGTKGPTSFFYGPVNLSADNVRKMWKALQYQMQQHHT